MPTLSISIPTQAVPRLKAALRQHFPAGLDPETGTPYPDPSDTEILDKAKQIVKEALAREVTDYESRKAEVEARRNVPSFDID